MCYHIVAWAPSVRARPAIKRCYNSMSAAQTARKRGIIGDRSPFHLDPNEDLAVVKCRDERCDCRRWVTGCNGANIPDKLPRRLIMCEKCRKGRRAAVEIIDPKTEQPRLYCERCAQKVALGCLFKGIAPPTRRVHADDASMEFIAELH